MAECSALAKTAKADSGGIGAIILAQSLLVLVALLIFIAYILYADRKIWAAVQMRRGPNVVGPGVCSSPSPTF
jgi:NADH:ubiquinone oxidoreductase subunit H